MKVAIVHDHFCQMGGAERVVEVMHRIFPEAPVYTTIVVRDMLWPGLRDAEIRTTWMQNLPSPRKLHRLWFPLYPRAIESLDLREYDLVLSSSSSFAKAAIVRPDARHVCYCHTPMRYAWNYDAYVARERFGPLAKRVLPPLIRRLRDWDLATRNRPSLYVANSSTVAARIRATYGREATIVHPPVGVQRYKPTDEPGDFHLIVSRLVAYKRIDLAIAAFSALERPLIIVGDGSARPALEKMAGPTIRFTGRIPDYQVADYYARCRALIFPGEEDFGIAPVEANAAGRPVVAYRAGGALDSVIDGKTGVFFAEQSLTSLIAAVERCERMEWDKQALRAHAASFSEENFVTKLRSVIQAAPTVADATRGMDKPVSASPRSPAGDRVRIRSAQPVR